MSIDRKINHYSLNNPASIYNEEALTALELAGRTAGLVNECVDNFNQLESNTVIHLNEQDKAIEKMNNETMPAKVDTEVKEYVNNGTFNKVIDDSLNNLNERVDNLLGSVNEGSTSLDAEVIDIRTSAEGKVYANAGEAVRAIGMGEAVKPYAMTMGKIHTPNISEHNLLGLSFYKKSFNGAWTNSTNRYCSMYIPASRLNVGDVVVCHDPNYVITIRVLSEDNSTVIEGEMASWKSYAILRPSHLEDNHNVCVFVKSATDDTVIDDGLEAHLSRMVFIYRNTYENRGFNRGNFDVNILQCGHNVIMLKSDISTTSSHKYYAYKDTDVSKEISFIDMEYIIDPIYIERCAPRFFVEDNNGNMCFFIMSYTGNSAGVFTHKLSGYYFDKATATYSDNVVSDTGNIYHGLVNIKAYSANGVTGVYINDKFITSFDYSNNLSNITRCGLFFKGNLYETQYCAKFDVGYREEGFLHISFDDQISILEDLTNNVGVYSSVFENEFLSKLKTLHNEYGCVFTLNLFVNNGTSEADTTFTLDNMTDAYLSEFVENSDWLKFAYHSKYTGTQSSTMTDLELKTNIDSAYVNIKRFAGSRACDKFIRFGYFNANKSAINYLVLTGSINGCLTADDDRTSNTGLTANEITFINKAHEYYDVENDVKYYRTIKRFDNGSIIDEVRKQRAISKTTPLVVFSHHLNTEDSYNALVEVLEYASKVGIKHGYPCK